MTLPQSQAWYPSSFHCEQGQKVGLLGAVPLDLGNGYQMGYVLPSPRSRGETPVQLYPTKSQMGPPSHLHQVSRHPQLPPHLASGSQRGVFLGVLHLPQQLKGIVWVWGRCCTALLQCLPRSLRCSPSHLVAPLPQLLLVTSPLGHFSNKRSWTNWR